ncbi:NADH-quinone oxidoreductase subunit NuoE [Pararhizobium sp. IMCC21322]|uniref:NADH-quinone oxidoreductase subunit NuoE n=1 Tax=Pararhizobium sp. IMCC21322 TaxID=3067903 RepID=UPI002742368E|nr:NADH-quinone oxidoreductase subunit NuoE [Pararhizobium sp. IMCC21322]
MSVRRLHSEQPDTFVFTQDNQDWAEGQISKFPEGREASAVIPLLWRAQEQHEGWLTEPAIRKVGEMLDMPYIRVLEVATFYTMFQLQPVGKKAHIQVCGTTPCMLRGAGDIKAVCQKRIAAHAHEISEDGNFSWEEVECLGACVNAPMVQIWKDTYEDLTVETFEAMLDAISDGKEITPGPQNGRHFSVPFSGRTSLDESSQEYGPEGGVPFAHLVDGATVASYTDAGVSINGGPQPDAASTKAKSAAASKPKSTKKAATKKASAKKSTGTEDEPKAEATAVPKDTTIRPTDVKDGADAEKTTAKKTTTAKKATPAKKPDAPETSVSAVKKPAALDKARSGGADDLKRIKGVGPKIEGILNSLGIFHFDQIAAWDQANKDWVDDHLSFKGRVDREDWIPQAEALANESKG